MKPSHYVRRDMADPLYFENFVSPFASVRDPDLLSRMGLSNVNVRPCVNQLPIVRTRPLFYSETRFFYVYSKSTPPSVHDVEINNSIRVIFSRSGPFRENISALIETDYVVPPELQNVSAASNPRLPSISGKVIFIFEVLHEDLRQKYERSLSNCSYYNELRSVDRGRY